ncbi:hypothetical protein LV779_08180 [Streptomyces thinghirensis]|nr:hypothetical protein [Streptomyces thinghirensis]
MATGLAGALLHVRRRTARGRRGARHIPLKITNNLDHGEPVHIYNLGTSLTTGQQEAGGRCERHLPRLVRRRQPRLPRRTRPSPGPAARETKNFRSASPSCRDASTSRTARSSTTSG